MCIIGEVADSAAASTGATDATVLRMVQRARDSLGSQSSDAARIQRHLRKLSRSKAMRGALVKNDIGQLVLPRERIRKLTYERTDLITGEIRRVKSYRIGWYQGGSGRVYVNDGVQAGRDLLRLLSDRSDWVAAA